MSDHDFFEWVSQQNFKEEPFKRDIVIYNVPQKWWRRILYRARMLIGRFVPRLKPQPSAVMHYCMPIGCETYPSGVVENIPITITRSQPT